MSKKMMLLALAVVSAAAFAVPSMAMAEDVPLHLKGLKADAVGAVTGPEGSLSTTSGETIKCKSVSGSATFESSTTGVLTLKFHSCTTVVFGFTVNCQTSGEPTGTISTTPDPFHLVTLPGKIPGVLVTPNASGAFAHFECAGVNKTVEGNGVIGKITKPACGAKSTTATVSFVATAHGVQEVTKVEGTETEYRLKTGGVNSAENATGTITFTGEEPTLECT